MQYRPVGDTGVKVSLLGIGTMRFQDEANAVAMIHRALDLGLNYLDCGAAYSFKNDGENAEAWVGKAIAGRDRSKMVISAKAQPRAKDPKLDRNIGVATRDQMWQCIESSLRRLGVEYLDFFQLWDLSAPEHFTAACRGKKAPVVALREAKEQGLVRHLGFTSHAEPEPRMNPMVVPAAVELLTRPRISGEAPSVVYTIEPVNSPPSEKP